VGGVVQEAEGEFDKAVAIYRKILEANPVNSVSTRVVMIMMTMMIRTGG
jgi:predicted TPR repeat methyltransferase